MANIISTWSLKEFGLSFGDDVSQGTVVNTETGQEFESVCFTDTAGNQTYATYSSNLGDQKVEYLQEHLDELQVVKLDSGNFKICKKGAKTWKRVKLFSTGTLD